MLKTKGFRGKSVKRRTGVTDAGVHVRAIAHLEVKMREIATISRTNSADFFTALDELIRPNEHFLQVGIHGLDDADLGGIFWIRDTMGQDDHFPPTRVRLARINDPAKACGVNGISETVKVIAQVSVQAETLRVVGKGAMLGTHGLIKTYGQGQLRDFQGAKADEGWIKQLCGVLKLPNLDGHHQQ